MLDDDDQEKVKQSREGAYLLLATCWRSRICDVIDNRTDARTDAKIRKAAADQAKKGGPMKLGPQGIGSGKKGNKK